MKDKKDELIQDCQKEMFCMTSGSNNNVYIVGPRKDPKKQIPVVSKSRIKSALKSAERYKKK